VQCVYSDCLGIRVVTVSVDRILIVTIVNKVHHWPSQDIV